VAPYPGRESWRYEGPDRDYWPWTPSEDEERKLGMGLGRKPAAWADNRILLATNLESTIDYMTNCRAILPDANLYWIQTIDFGTPWLGDESLLEWLGFDIIDPASFWSLNCELHRVCDWSARVNARELFDSAQDAARFMEDRQVALLAGAPVEDMVSVVTVRVGRWKQ